MDTRKDPIRLPSDRDIKEYLQKKAKEMNFKKSLYELGVYAGMSASVKNPAGGFPFNLREAQREKLQAMFQYFTDGFHNGFKDNYKLARKQLIDNIDNLLADEQVQEDQEEDG